MSSLNHPKANEPRPSKRSSGVHWSEWEIEYVLKHWKGSKDSSRISTYFWHKKRIHRTPMAISKMAVNGLGIRGRNLEGFTSISKVCPGTVSTTIRLLCKEMGITVTTVSHCLALVPNEDLPRLRERLVVPTGWLTTKVAARRAKMSESRLRDYVRRGEILGKRYCVNNWRICPASLAGFIAKHHRASMMLDSGRWMTGPQAAKRLGITNAGLASFIRRGRIQAEKMSIPDSIGLSFVLETSKVEALLAEREAKGTPKPGRWADAELRTLQGALEQAKDPEAVAAHLAQEGIRRSPKAIAKQITRMTRNQAVSA